MSVAAGADRVVPQQFNEGEGGTAELVLSAVDNAKRPHHPGSLQSQAQQSARL
jgi:hypothetical protein